MEEINSIKLKEILYSLLTLKDLNQQEIKLLELTSILELNPVNIISIYTNITSLILEENSNLITRWCSSIIESVLCRNLLNSEKKLTLALQSLTAIARMLSSNDITIQKTGIQCFASCFPLLLKNACSGGDHQTWSHAVALKDTVLRIWRNGSLGAKLSALKVVQRVIQTQTKGTADPRLQRTAEPNLSLCISGHPFLNPRKLELEATELLEECIKGLFTSSIADVISASANTLSNLVKIRPVFSNLILTALSNWTPGALIGQPNTQVKSVEKTIKICLTHLLKTAHANAFASQINDFLARQAHRMEHAANDAKREKEQEATKKRQSISEEISNSSKRRKLETVIDTAAVFTGVGAGKVDSALAQFDVTSLPINIVVDLVISSFQALPSDILRSAIDDAWIRLPPRDPVETSGQGFTVKAEVLDPLKLDLGEEELILRGEVLAAEPENEVDVDGDIESALAESALDLNDGSADLILPSSLSTSTKTLMMESAMRRLCEAGVNGVAPSLWAPLVSRLITRGLPNEEVEENELTRKESLRSIVFDFVIGDISSRLEIARLWLNEEWYVEHRAAGEEASETRAYDRWLRKLLGHLSDFSSNRDKSFAQFIVDLPEIPSDEIGRLGEMCVNPDQVQLGFTALRDLALLRPPVRQKALDILLGLTTHSEKLTRNASIMTVKRWAPDVQPLGKSVIAFALELFSRLEVPVSKLEEPEMKVEEGVEAKDEDDMDMDDEEKEEVIVPKVIPYAEVKDGSVVDRLPPPSTLAQVVQHVELLLALTVKNSELLINIFDFYPRLQPFAQDSLLTLITPLIRSLGANHLRVAEVIENCPIGADALLLRLLTILVDKSRLPAPLIASVQILAKKRKLHPRFYVMIISECSKDDIITYLPRLATLLNNTPEEKAIVRSAFLSILASASQSVAAQNARNAELLTAVELMTLLHRSEKEIGLKGTIEAIAICFSMPDAFRPEILAAFMQHVVDQPELPVLFLRTAIQAVTTYKTNLSSFVSTILLSRLIAREVWNTKPLWDGFLRLAKITAPESFPAILQLPQENLLDLIKQQPGLRDDLRSFAAENFPNLHNRTDDYVEAFGEIKIEVQKIESSVSSNQVEASHE